MKKKHKNTIHDLKKKKLEPLITAIAALIAAVLGSFVSASVFTTSVFPRPRMTVFPKKITPLYAMRKQIPIRILSLETVRYTYT